MCKVNFVTEFNTFMRYARDNSLSLRERMFWVALFYIANDRAIYNEQTQEYDWPDGFIQVSNNELNLYTCLDKRAIENIRNGMKQRGLIDFVPGMKNKKHPAYKINYLTACDVGDKIVPNHTPNNAPNHVPNHTPNHVPNHTPNHVPDSVPKGGFLGTNLHPTMPPYPKPNNININNNQGGEGARENQMHFHRGIGFVDLQREPEGNRSEGLVPMGREAGL